jgi:hypothetical protein
VRRPGAKVSLLSHSELNHTRASFIVSRHQRPNTPCAGLRKHRLGHIDSRRCGKRLGFELSAAIHLGARQHYLGIGERLLPVIGHRHRKRHASPGLQLGRWLKTDFVIAFRRLCGEHGGEENHQERGTGRKQACAADKESVHAFYCKRPLRGVHGRPEAQLTAKCSLNTAPAESSPWSCAIQFAARRRPAYRSTGAAIFRPP